jgi:hypothetical protein
MTGGPRWSVTAGAAQAEQWAGGPKGQAGYCTRLGRSGWLGRLAATARWARRRCGLNWVGEGKGFRNLVLGLKRIQTNRSQI